MKFMEHVWAYYVLGHKHVKIACPVDHYALAIEMRNDCIDLRELRNGNKEKLSRFDCFYASLN